jgi:hypothetical protein
VVSIKATLLGVEPRTSRSVDLFATDCAMPHLDKQSELFIFESFLTTFKLSIVFRGSWGSIENRLEPKTEPPSGNLAGPNP